MGRVYRRKTRVRFTSAAVAGPGDLRAGDPGRALLVAHRSTAEVNSSGMHPAQNPRQVHLGREGGPPGGPTGLPPVALQPK
jgi:hypothetical protein